jgi:hypothetical protein
MRPRLQGPCSSRRQLPKSAGAGHHRHRRRGQVSLTDELIRRLRLDQGDALRVAVISIDPSAAARAAARCWATASA